MVWIWLKKPSLPPLQLAGRDDDFMVVAMSPLRGYLKCTYSTPGSFSRICACMVPNVQTSDPVHVTTD